MNPPAIKPLIDITPLTAAAVLLYAVPTTRNVKTYVRGLVFSNVLAVAHTYTLYVVPSGGSASAANARYTAVSLAANSTIERSFREGEWTLSSGSQIYALADAANAINITMCGAEQT